MNPLESLGNFFFGKPDRPTWKPGGSNKPSPTRGTTSGGSTWREFYPGVGEVVFGPGHRVLGRFVDDANFTPVTPGRPSPYRVPGSVPPIITGLDRGGNIDRTQSDQYRAAMGQQAPAYPSFPLTPQGQFERYFSSGSPEMDRYFGAASRGTGAPKSLEEMNTLASQQRAPGKTPADLATYYRAQSAAGRGGMDEILDAMEYKGTPLEAWAKANPMLAQREYNKRFPGGRSASLFPAGSVAKLNVPVEGAFAAGPLSSGSPEALQERVQFPGPGFLAGAKPFEMPALNQTSAPSSGSFQGMDTSQLFGRGQNSAAFTLPGGALTQGQRVSQPFQKAADMSAQFTNPLNGIEVGQLKQSDDTLQNRIAKFYAGLGAQ